MGFYSIVTVSYFMWFLPPNYQFLIDSLRNNLHFIDEHAAKKFIEFGKPKWTLPCTPLKYLLSEIGYELMDGKECDSTQQSISFVLFLCENRRIKSGRLSSNRIEMINIHLVTPD